MKVDYLVYTGNRDHGSLTVREVKASSPWRKFEYYKAQKLRIGKDIPEQIANRILKGYKSLFKIEQVDLDEIESFGMMFRDLIENFNIENESILKKVSEVLNAEIQKEIDNQENNSKIIKRSKRLK